MMVFVKYVLLLFTIINLLTHSAELCYEHPQSPLPYAVLMHQAIYSPSRTAVYLFGGRGYPDWITDVYKWDKSQPNSWFEKFGSIPSNTNSMTSYVNNAVVAGERVYFIGIRDQQNLFLPYVYDLQSEGWVTPSNIRPPPDSLTHGCLAASETHIYMVAGTDLTDADRQPRINVYEIASDSWTLVALDSITGLQPNRGGWNSQYCAVVENHLYVFGGNKKGLDSTQPGLVAAAFRMDLSTHSIEQLPSMPQAQAFGRAVHHQGKIYFVGGSKQDWDLLHDIIAYDIATQTYSVAYDLQSLAFDAAGVLALDGLLYIFGGEELSTAWFTPMSEVRICEFPTDEPTSDPSEPTKQPTNLPTFVPSTVLPTSLPSIQPSLGPSEYPSQSPTGGPTDAPTTRAPLQPPVVPSTTDQQQRGQLSTAAEETRATTAAATTDSDGTGDDDDDDDDDDDNLDSDQDNLVTEAQSGGIRELLIAILSCIAVCTALLLGLLLYKCVKKPAPSTSVPQPHVPEQEMHVPARPAAMLAVPDNEADIDLSADDDEKEGDAVQVTRRESEGDRPTAEGFADSFRPQAGAAIVQAGNAFGGDFNSDIHFNMNAEHDEEVIGDEEEFGQTTRG